MSARGGHESPLAADSGGDSGRSPEPGRGGAFRCLPMAAHLAQVPPPPTGQTRRRGHRDVRGSGGVRGVLVALRHLRTAHRPGAPSTPTGETVARRETTAAVRLRRHQRTQHHHVFSRVFGGQITALPGAVLCPRRRLQAARSHSQQHPLLRRGRAGRDPPAGHREHRQGRAVPDSLRHARVAEASAWWVSRSASSLVVSWVGFRATSAGPPT